jgi:hypothetical protein
MGPFLHGPPEQDWQERHYHRRESPFERERRIHFQAQHPSSKYSASRVEFFHYSFLEVPEANDGQALARHGQEEANIEQRHRV